MTQPTYEIPQNTEYAQLDSQKKPEFLRNSANSGFMILALVLGAVSLIASVSALVAAVSLVNNLESKITKLEL